MNLENKILKASELFAKEIKKYSLFNVIYDVSGTDTKGKHFCLNPDVYITDEEKGKAFVLLNDNCTNVDGECLATTNQNCIFIKGDLEKYTIDDRITYIKIFNAEIIEPIKEDIEMLEKLLQSRIHKVENELRELRSLFQ